MINPPALTPIRIIRQLEAGNAVDLEAPGWMDTTRRACPDCGRLVMTFKSEDHAHVRFEYGLSSAVPHRCGQAVLDQDHPRWLKLEAVNRELEQLARQRVAEEQRRSLP